MHLEYMLYILLITTSTIMLHFIKKAYLHKKTIASLEKKLTGNLTDFEKLEFAVKLIDQVKINKLRPDQFELWINYLEQKLLNLKK